MKVPVEWLGELCAPGWTPEQIAERLSMTGTEVERVSSGAPELGPEFVVGSVLSVEAHPDADRLSVCRVDAAGERTIVCGAPNVAEGQRVAVALPGARLPDGTKLRKAKLRGVASEGMILSEVELGLGEEADGIMVLEGGLEPGTDLTEALGGGEALELEVTTNRPDCLSVYGVARELHAVSGATLEEAPWADGPEQGEEPETAAVCSVEVAVPDLCPRFSVRAFSGVEVGPSPEWLCERLRAAGQRPINNVVDITNYVMLLTGQPLHAFDLDRVSDSRLEVREAADGESLACLDGVERALPVGAVVICDAEGPASIAGIMGGSRTQVTDTTERVLLEAATWDGPGILRTSRSLSLRSEASARFEKGLHPALCDRAQVLAGRLLVELCGATPAQGLIDVYANPPELRMLTLRPERASALVGMEITAEDCVGRLRALGFGASEPDGEGVITVEVPPERDGDVRREVDLIEEVARLGDLDENLPATLPGGAASAGGLSRGQRLRRRTEDYMRDAGFSEIVSWSFTSEAMSDELLLPPDHEARAALQIGNPLASDQAVMRTLLIGGLLEAARVSSSHGADGVRLFESGRVYLPSAPKPPRGAGPEAGQFAGRHEPPAVEEHRIAGLLVGPSSQGWRADPTPADFFAAKGVLESLLDSIGVEADYAGLDEPFLVPGRAASVTIGGIAAGWVGEPHPKLIANWGLGEAAAFEIALAPLIGAAKAGVEDYREPPSFPPIREDLSVVVAEATGAGQVLDAVVDAGSNLLDDAEVVDVYESSDLGPGRRSLTLRLVFRAEDRTLSDADVADLRAAIISAVESVGGEVRG